MELPKEKSPIKGHLDKIVWLLFGAPKIGKSTLAASAEEAIFAATEQGLNFLSTYNVPINSWEDFKEFGAKLIKEKEEFIALGKKPRFKTIIIDTTDILFKYCEEAVCKEKDIDSPGDLGYGKGWSFLKSEFQRVILRLAGAGFGFIFISHMKEQKIKQRNQEYDKIMPTMSESCRKILLPMVDVIGLLTVDFIKDKDFNIIGEEHVLVTKGNASLEVGARGGPNMTFPPKIILPRENGFQAIQKAIEEYNKK